MLDDGVSFSERCPSLCYRDMSLCDTVHVLRITIIFTSHRGGKEGKGNGPVLNKRLVPRVPPNSESKRSYISTRHLHPGNRQGEYVRRT